MANQINTTKKIVVSAIIAGVLGIGAGVVIDSDPDPIVIDNTERVLIDRSEMSWDEYKAFIAAANNAGQLEFKDIDGDYTVIDALRNRVGK